MLSPDLARALRDAGLAWRPANGDRFVIPDRDLDDQVFVVSDMVIERLQPPSGGEILAFNGTTEWALDSLESGEALWLPREEQLRAALEEAFLGLERLPGDLPGYAVTVAEAGGSRRYVDVDPESAYARALLDRLPR
jgi:hypothetical protein